MKLRERVRFHGFSDIGGWGVGVVLTFHRAGFRNEYVVITLGGGILCFAAGVEVWL